MTYWLKEDVVLRQRAADGQLEVYVEASGWQPYPFRRQDLEFVKRLTPEEARAELVAGGCSATHAGKAIPED